MNKPEFITFTGIDDRTNLTKADELARQYPIEWGVLFSPDNRDSRFPCNQAVSEILEINGSKSAHVCGGFSRHIIECGEVHENIPADHFSRMQVNSKANIEVSTLSRLQEKHGLKIILQHRMPEFTESAFLQLYDLSGGRGEMPSHIPSLPGDSNKMVGYAGGMGPGSVLYYLSRIKGGLAPFWIDMESKVRKDGWFDLDRVARVCKIIFD